MFSIIFFCAYIFDLQLLHIMFIIYGYLTNNARQRYLVIEANCREASLKSWGNHCTSTLWSLPQHTNIAFYSSFEENCR